MIKTVTLILMTMINPYGPQNPGHLESTKIVFRSESNVDAQMLCRKVGEDWLQSEKRDPWKFHSFLCEANQELLPVRDSFREVEKKVTK